MTRTDKLRELKAQIEAGVYEATSQNVPFIINNIIIELGMGRETFAQNLALNIKAADMRATVLSMIIPPRRYTYVHRNSAAYR